MYQKTILHYFPYRLHYLVSRKFKEYTWVLISVTTGTEDTVWLYVAFLLR